MQEKETANGIRYEFIDTKNIQRSDFEEIMENDSREENARRFILEEGIPYKEKIGNFWAIVQEHERYGRVDKYHGILMGNVNQYALCLASRVKSGGWEALKEEHVMFQHLPVFEVGTEKYAYFSKSQNKVCSMGILEKDIIYNLPHHNCRGLHYAWTTMSE